jgi:hypothetical protein
MNSPLDEACAILDDFENEIARKRAFYKQTAADNLNFEPVLPEGWQEKYYRMWLHAVTDVWERNELEQWLMDYPPSTAVANSPAVEVYAAWRKWLPVAGPVAVSKVVDYDKKSRSYIEREAQNPSEAFYTEHDKFEIEEPHLGEILYDFIVRLARSFEDQHDEHQKRERKKRELGDWLEERALKSFLDFVRKNYPSEQVAFIEHIFPQKMDLHFGRIIRLISPEAFPVPEQTAAEILIELARRCRSGNLTARHTAIEALALCWICIACSRIRLPKNLEKVRDMKPEAILSGSGFGLAKHPTFGSKALPPHLTEDTFSVLQVPTWFGDQPLKISNRIAAFLKIVACMPSKKSRTTILQRSRQKLDHMFSLALQSVSPNPEYGNITYLSLLINQPHIHGDHRTQPNYKIFK